MAEVVSHAETGPDPLHSHGEGVLGCTAPCSKKASVHISTHGLMQQQDAIFDIQVTHPKVSPLSQSEFLNQLSAFENQKKRQCVARVIKGEAHPKMKTKVRGACDKPFLIYKRLNNCAVPVLDSDDVLVVEEEAFYVWGMPWQLPLKRHHYPVRGRHNYSVTYPKLLIACTSDLRHSTQCPGHYKT